MTARRLVSLKAYNGGSGSSTVTIASSGQTSKQVTVGAGQVVTIDTGWSGTSTSVTISSTNGWDTNFDDLGVDDGGSSPPPPPPPPPPSGQTVTFDDLSGQNQVLNGEYPTGVIDWGSNSRWYHSGPWGLLTTKNASFNGSGITSATFSFLSARRLVSLKAYNGGTGSSTVTISSPGHTAKQVVVAAGQLVTIDTGWTATSTSVTLSSTNGWDTNFDDLAIDGGATGKEFEAQAAGADGEGGACGALGLEFLALGFLRLLRRRQR